MFEQIKNAILTFLDQYELPTLLVLIFIEELGLPLPLPSDVLIAYAGARHGRDPVNALLVIATVSLAVALGSSVLYEVSKRGGPRVVRLMSKVLHLKPERVEKLQGWFHKRGAWGIVLGRLIPGLRIPTTVMAGLAGVPYRVFIPSTCFAAVLWSTVFYFAGDAIGRLFEPIAGYIGAEPGRTLWPARDRHRPRGSHLQYAAAVANTALPHPPSQTCRSRRSPR